jgi:hypothetical protein
MYNEWVGVAAVKSDLINPNLTFINSIKINQFILDNINNVMLKFDQLLENQNDLSVESQNIQQILNENLSINGWNSRFTRYIR